MYHQIKQITAIDRRNVVRTEKSVHQVQLINESLEKIEFLADWRFPVPASKRRYFLLRKEIAVEECGKISRRNIFKFIGTFTKPNQCS